MKFMYPAVFRKNEDGTYNGYFPDLECCASTGDTLNEAIENANEAAYNWITVELDEEEPNLPSISDPSDLNLTPEDIVRIISVNIRFYEGWDEWYTKHYATILKTLKPTGIVSHITQIHLSALCFQSFHLHNPSTYSNYTVQPSIFMFHYQHLPVTTPLLFSPCRHCHASTSTDTPTMECPKSGILSLCRYLKNRHYTNSKCP